MILTWRWTQKDGGPGDGDGAADDNGEGEWLDG